MNTIYEPELAMGLNQIEIQTKTIKREREKKQTLHKTNIEQIEMAGKKELKPFYSLEPYFCSCCFGNSLRNVHYAIESVPSI